MHSVQPFVAFVLLLDVGKMKIKKNKIKYDSEKGMPYYSEDKTIRYNEPEIREKVEKIIKKFGEPFLITKNGELLYEDCVVIPCFRDTQNDEE